MESTQDYKIIKELKKRPDGTSTSLIESTNPLPKSTSPTNILESSSQKDITSDTTNNQPINHPVQSLSNSQETSSSELEPPNPSIKYYKYILKTKNVPSSSLIDVESKLSLIKQIHSDYIIKYIDYKIPPMTSNQNSLSTIQIITEYIIQEDLNTILNKRDNISKELIWTIFIRLSLGLHHIHLNKVTHNNIQSKNIYLYNSNKIKICNFKLDNEINQRDIKYLSPEMIKLNKETNSNFENAANKEIINNNKNDIWALGCIFYELVTRKKAFDDGNNIENNILGIKLKVPAELDDDYKQILNSIFIFDQKNRPTINDIILNKIFLKYVAQYNLFDEVYKEYLYSDILFDIFISRFSQSKEIMSKVLRLLTKSYLRTNSVQAVYEVRKDNDQIKLLGEGNKSNKIASFSKLNNDNIELYVNKVKIPYTNRMILGKKGTYNVIIKFLEPLESLEGMFYKINGLTSINLSNLDSNKVTNMDHMLDGCLNLTNANLNYFDTSNCESMVSMFDGCSRLTSINVSSFNTSKVTSMNKMFGHCSNISTINLNYFDTSNVTDMSGMFCKCISITNIMINSFDTGNVVDMSNMFDGCRNLIGLNLTSFNTSKVTSMQSMFYECSKIAYLNLSTFDTSSLSNMEWMFHGCENLLTLNLSSFNTKSVYNMYGLFAHCSNLADLNLKSFNTNKVKDIGNMFNGCSCLNYLDLSSFDCSQIEYLEDVFNDCSNLKMITIKKNDDKFANVIKGYKIKIEYK